MRIACPTAIVFLALAGPALAAELDLDGHTDQAHDQLVIRDTLGRRQGSVEPDSIAGRYDIRDNFGRIESTIEPAADGGFVQRDLYGRSIRTITPAR